MSLGYVPGRHDEPSHVDKRNAPHDATQQPNLLAWWFQASQIVWRAQAFIRRAIQSAHDRSSHIVSVSQLLSNVALLTMTGVVLSRVSPTDSATATEAHLSGMGTGMCDSAQIIIINHTCWAQSPRASRVLSCTPLQERAFAGRNAIAWRLQDDSVVFKPFVVEAVVANTIFITTTPEFLAGQCQFTVA